MFRKLYVQVLIAIVLGIVLGLTNPALGIAMKPLGDGFIKLIKMVIPLVIFCTVVPGIAGMQDAKRVGRVGGKAILYFEIVSTIALLIGVAVAVTIRPGAGFNVDPATLDTHAVESYAAAAKNQNA